MSDVDSVQGGRCAQISGKNRSKLVFTLFFAIICISMYTIQISTGNSAYFIPLWLIQLHFPEYSLKKKVMCIKNSESDSSSWFYSSCFGSQISGEVEDILIFLMTRN